MCTNGPDRREDYRPGVSDVECSLPVWSSGRSYDRGGTFTGRSVTFGGAPRKVTSFCETDLDFERNKRISTRRESYLHLLSYEEGIKGETFYSTDGVF